MLFTSVRLCQTSHCMQIPDNFEAGDNTGVWLQFGIIALQCDEKWPIIYVISKWIYTPLKFCSV